MRRTSILLVGSALLAMLALGILWNRDRPRSIAASDAPIELYCAASNRVVVEEIRKRYEQEFGRSVKVQYGASQTLLATIEVSGTGDLYLPADDSFIVQGASKNLLAETIPLARMQAVLVVQKGNPKGIHSFDDLQQPGLRVVQASPESTAIGQLTKRVLSAAEKWDELEKVTLAQRTTVTDAANDVVVGAADVAIVYDAVAAAYPDLEVIRIPEFEPAVSRIMIAVTNSTTRSADALHFARYLGARDRGLEDYRKHGFQTEDGDLWADRPEINLYAGSMLRPAIDDTIAAFEKREGVNVTRVYNGCGILVAQMKAGHVPDAYFACDQEFMKQVPDLFPAPVDVSKNQLVILVHKGNPLGIRTLTDLTRAGLRVGIGHEKQCAMGWLTQNTLREGGVQNEVMKNVTMQTPTGDLLVNQLRTGALDAAVAYLSNAAGSADVLDAIQIQGLQCAIATQPFAVSPKSRYAQTTSRLFEQICSDESREIFEAEGFGWGVRSDVSEESN